MLDIVGNIITDAKSALPWPGDMAVGVIVWGAIAGVLGITKKVKQWALVIKLLEALIVMFPALKDEKVKSVIFGGLACLAVVIAVVFLLWE